MSLGINVEPYCAIIKRSVLMWGVVCNVLGYCRVDINVTGH